MSEKDHKFIYLFETGVLVYIGGVQMIDDTDKEILNAVLDNSRLSYRQIAKKVGVSVATVMNRVNRLEKDGIIKGYTANLDYEKLGFDVNVIVTLKISKGKLFEIEKKVATMPEVFAVYDQTGPRDTTLVAKFKSRKSMDQFLKKIQTFDFIESTETSVILNTIKEKQVKL